MAKSLQSNDGIQRIPATTQNNKPKEKETQTQPSTPPGGNRCGKCGGKHPTKTCNKQPKNPKLGANGSGGKGNNKLPGHGNINVAKSTKRMSGRRGN